MKFLISLVLVLFASSAYAVEPSDFVSSYDGDDIPLEIAAVEDSDMVEDCNGLTAEFADVVIYFCHINQNQTYNFEMETVKVVGKATLVDDFLALDAEYFDLTSGDYVGKVKLSFELLSYGGVVYTAALNGQTLLSLFFTRQ